MRSALFAAALMLAPAFVSGQALDKFKVATDDRAATQHYQNAWDMLRSEKWEEASREFQTAIDLKPNYRLAYYGLGRSNMGQKKFADAIHAYETCRDLYERQASQNIVNAQEAERLLQDDLTSIDLAISRLQTGPQTPQVSNQIAQLNMQKDRMKNRTGNANNMSLTSPVPPFVSLALGSAYLRAERFPDAEQQYKKAVEADSKYGEAYSNLAALYLMTGKYEDAAKAVKSAEKTGFKVNPGLKDEIEKKRKAGSW